MNLKLLFTFLVTITLCRTMSSTAQTIFINEIHYDNSGTDINEAIEIAGPAGTDLSGWSLILYNGATSQMYRTINLSGTIINQQNGYGTLVELLPSNGIQNGAPDGIALVNSANAVIQFLSYEGVIDATDGPAAGITSVDIGVSETNTTQVGASLQLIGNGTNYADFDWQVLNTNTYGAINSNQTFETTMITPLINEFVFNHTGSDTDEFLEIVAGPNTDLSEYTVLVIEGDSETAGTIDQVIQLATTNSLGYLTIFFPPNAVENGSLTLLLVKNFTGTLGEDVDSDNDAQFDSTPWEAILDAVGVYDGGDSDSIYTNVVLTPYFDSGIFTVGGASRLPNAIDTDSVLDWTRNDFDGQGLPSFPLAMAQPGEAINTPGFKNQLVAPTALIINELDADTQGSDVLEFIELYDGGIGNTTLDGYVIVNYNGNGDTSYNAFDLDGFSTNAEGYFVIGNANVANVNLVVPNNSFQNGADAVALYFDDANSFPNGTALTTNRLIDAIVYGTDDDDDLELLVLLEENSPQLNENSNGNKDGESLQRMPNGTGGPLNTNTFVVKKPTPGVANEAIIVEPGEIISIAAARAAAIGTPVTITGVLTATDNFKGPAFIQDSTGGIAVFNQELQSDANFKIGDSLTLTGTRVAFNDQVQIDSVVDVVANGKPKQPIIPLPITLSELANHPGELVIVENTAFPNPGDLLFGNANFTLTDGSGTGELRIDNDVTTLVGKVQPITCPQLTGVVGRFREFYQLLPRNADDMSCALDFISPGDTIGFPKEETLDVVTWNIEWFGDEANSPVGNNPMSDAIQRDSTAVVLKKLNADIYAVQEIADDALFAELVSALPGYDFILSDAFSNPSSTSNVQKVGFIYKTETVNIVATRPMFTSIHPLYNGGDASTIDDYPNETTRFFASGRLPFLMTADITINGVTERMDFIALHARANSGTNAQDRYDMRKYDVEVLKDSLDTNFANNKVVLLGDFNDDVDATVADISLKISSYEQYVKDTANYAIVSSALSKAGLRSYIFRENMIDHIAITNELQNSYLENSVTVHYDVYDNDYAFNTSDHLPVSARFLLTPQIVDNDCVGGSVIAFDQGLRKDGRRVASYRSRPEKALGSPKERQYFNFVSLGFGGAITIALNNEIFDNVDSDEFMVYESTGFRDNIPCHYFPEEAEVFASVDGETFVSLGSTCQDGAFDLASGGLRSAKYIKVVDRSDSNKFPWFADGYDLDAIVCVASGETIPLQKRSVSIDKPTDYDSELLTEADTVEGVEIVASPNPVTDRLSIRFTTKNRSSLLISITDVTGREVYTQQAVMNFGSSILQVDMKSFPQGIYVIKAIDKANGSQYIEKIVKE
ncbi:T9SS type A sorting domain-containing protein [Aquimarina sp. W85]|uniref:T9SS type A sorting domain-containing protein n=1 Tax=Aquimarina rhodophyticola TaxID=3342246 RepID=UPI00366D9CCA